MHPKIKSRRTKLSHRSEAGRNIPAEARAWPSVVILQIVASSGFFYRPCGDDDEAIGVMKRYALAGWDSKVIGIQDENRLCTDTEFGNM